ncbi:ATP-binding protein [Luteimonas deserti]|uniref:Putative DNA binding domain-containing protein n=1 Tax=Luteimonas deserti TaxID=2752306 RepID=A0A7Z0TXM3_9GAMM|nr:RNA-binding domain-containing protein [Luteimonas deserti]NYZ61522.1 putative DNA binding domain-containing protein [Luteimonas deserti]
MDKTELQALLAELIARWESEVVEFKQATDAFGTDDIGRYFAALANEANLRGAECGWLIFGVNNRTRGVVGTDYRPEAGRLHSLKMQIAQNSDPRITFRDIHELHHADGRVLLFQIPAAPRGMAIAWKGHYYARASESLVPLGLDKLDEIRNQTLAQDWTAQVVAGATLDDLDEAATHKARDSFAQKHANRFAADEVAAWPLATFLDRARLTQDGAITRTTLLLLGKREASHWLNPNPAQLTWKLEGQERAYEHFAPPFLLSTTALYQRIRNVQLRILPQDKLIPVEVAKYDQRIVLEALHNCIAHQDYTRNGRVVVTERPDRLLFENVGGFFEGQPDEYIGGEKTPLRYRNPFLTQAMSELNMIDTMGYGIHSIYQGQVRRYFPLPDYDLSESQAVKMTLYGGVVDPAYSRLLIQNTDLPLADVLALDRVQKKLAIPDDAAGRLRRTGLIEGRKPNYFVSASVAKATASVADYIRTRGQDDAFYLKLITDYLTLKSEASRADFNQLLLDKLSDALSDQQKARKISGLLTKLRKQGAIVNAGSDTAPRWKLTRP